MDKEFALFALELAGHAAKLGAVVEWCVNHSGECLDDNPHQLEYARKVLAEARAGMKDEANVSNIPRH